MRPKKTHIDTKEILPYNYYKKRPTTYTSTSLSTTQTRIRT